MKLESMGFDSVVIGTYMGNAGFYYKIMDLDMDSRKKEALSSIKKIDDGFFKYVLFAQTGKDFLSYKLRDNLEETEALCAYIPFLGSSPGTILEQKKGMGNFLEIPEAVIVNDGRIFVGEGLLKVSDFMINIPLLVKNTGEIFRQFDVIYN